MAGGKSDRGRGRPKKRPISEDEDDELDLRSPAYVPTHSSSSEPGDGIIYDYVHSEENGDVIIRKLFLFYCNE
jgi:hypothetical protein